MSDYEKLKISGSPRRIRPLADQKSATFASSLRRAKEVRSQKSVVRAKAHRAFTLAEMLVSIAVLTLVVLFVAQLMKSATTITSLGNKRVDADTQARMLFDRMAVDFNQMLKRNDVSYWVKTASNPEPGNDQIAFFSAVPGNNSTVTTTMNSRFSLVAYRVNTDPTSASYNKLER